MSRQIKISTTAKTYATEANAKRAMSEYNDSLCYMIIPTESNRYQILVLNAGDYGVSVAHNGHMIVAF